MTVASRDAEDRRDKAEARLLSLLGPDTPQRDEVVAAVLAAGVRNGLEELHVAGVFDDDQVPALNNGVRARLFDALTNVRRLSDGDRDPGLLAWGAANLDEVDDTLTAAAPNACIVALDAFALSIGAETERRLAIAEDGLNGLMTTVDLLHRLRDPDDADARDEIWWVLLVYVPKVVGEVRGSV
ncbi:MAG TPA: hypothetical protein VMY78_07135 [Solirubrobacteraceae bacterium]|nr:hypothetical protein [Solirubrobacteraceae bacterium]